MYQGSTLKIGRVVAFTLGAILLAAFLYVFFTLKGSVMVFDESGEVVEAVVTNDYTPEQRLYRLPGGTFWAFPQLEGEVEVRCRNGATHRGGYVTRGMHTRMRVGGEVPCGNLVDID